MTKAYRSNLTWEQWELIADLSVPRSKAGWSSPKINLIAMIRIMVRRLA